jgi:sugar lactone lactonase YvrE
LRLKQVSLTAAISVVAGLTTATVGLAGSAAWADSTAALPLSHYAHMLVDTAHQHIFFSQGAGSTGIVVTDLAGTPVTTLTGEQGATGLALSPDGTTLYAALADGDAVAAVDTATLTESARYATGTGSGPVSVAVAGGRVWYGDMVGDRGAVGSIDPTAADPVATSQSVLANWPAAPQLATGGGVLAAEELSTNTTDVATFDVSSGTATAMTHLGVSGGSSTGFQVTGDGKKVLLADSSDVALRAYRTADMAMANPSVYYTGGIPSAPNSLSLDTDGTIAVGSTTGSAPGVYFYAGSQLRENYVPFASGTLAPDGLEWGGDGTTLYGVTQDSTGAYTLNVLASPKLTDTQLALSLSGYAVPTREFTLNGTFATNGFVPAGAQLQVTRDGVQLPDVTLGADGTFAVRDTRADEGTDTYQVSYAGDATHRPATTSLKVYVTRLTTDVEFQAFSSATPHSVVFTGTLSSRDLGTFPQGTTLQVTRTNEDTQESVPLPSVPVDPATGAFTVTDAPDAAGWFTYRVAFAGDTAHQPSANEPSAIVKPYTPTLTLKAPTTTVTRGAALTFGGTLGDAPYTAGETVTVSRTDLAHTTTPVTWTVPVGTDGKITVKDTPAVGGADTYKVDYPGDAAHQAATASATVQVSRAATAVSVTSNESTYSYGATATVTAHLGTTYNGRTVSIYATPAGGKKTLVKTAAVDSNGNLKATYKLTHNTTFTASFAGDYRYAPATATRAVHDRVGIAEKLGGYYTSTTYGSVTYRVYHHTAKPQVSGTVTPDKSGQCMRFQAQEYYDKAWHTLTTSSCFSMAPGSVGVTQLSLTNAVNQKFRVRTEYVAGAKDTTNVSTWGGWLYLTVRT